MVICDIDNNLLSAIQRFFVEQKFFDVKVTRHDRELLGCHKILLSSFSTHFEALLQGTEGCAILSLDAVDAKYVDHLPDIVKFMYGCSINVEKRKFRILYEAAEIFGVSSLMKLMQAKIPDCKNTKIDQESTELLTFKPCAVGPLLLVIFQQFKNDDKFIDVEIGCQNKVLFRCHKLVLAAFSVYFELLLTSTEGCAILNLDAVNSLYVRQLDVLINLMYGKKPTPQQPNFDVNALKEAVKIFQITFSWQKIESCMFSKRKKISNLPIRTSKSLKNESFTPNNIVDYAASTSNDPQKRGVPDLSATQQETVDINLYLPPSQNEPSTSSIGNNISCDDQKSCSSSQEDFEAVPKNRPRAKIASKPFVCGFCNSVFQYKSLLSRHWQLKHTQVKPYQCMFCDHTTKEKGSLEVHIRSIHTRTKPFKCMLCDRRCATQSQMSRHLRTHTGEKPYKCVTCQESFPEKRDLDVHVAKKHSKIVPFACKFCDSKFYRKDHLRKHVQSVHNPHI